MAMPARPLADEPPVTVSRESLKVGVNRLATVAGGLLASSLIAGRVTVPLATGASLMAGVVVPMVIVPDDHWLVVPMLAEMSRAPVAGRPPVPSEMCAVSAPGVPFQSPFAKKRSVALDGMTIALVLLSPVVGMSTHVPPPLVEYCQVPCAAVEALPVMAMPAADVPVEPPGIVSALPSL